MAAFSENKATQPANIPGDWAWWSLAKICLDSMFVVCNSEIKQILMFPYLLKDKTLLMPESLLIY